MTHPFSLALLSSVLNRVNADEVLLHPEDFHALLLRAQGEVGRDDKGTFVHFMGVKIRGRNNAPVVPFRDLSEKPIGEREE
jgi:hypothetical protein